MNWASSPSSLINVSVSTPMRLLSLAHTYQILAETFAFATSHHTRSALSYELINEFRAETTEMAKPFPKLRPLLANIHSDLIELKHAGDKFDYKHAWDDLELHSLMNPCYSPYLALEKHATGFKTACSECS